MISINIKPFASYREMIGEKGIVMNLPEGASVSDLISDLVDKYPSINNCPERPRCSSKFFY